MLLAALALTFATGADSRTQWTEASPVDTFLAGCPTAGDVASINADLQLSFEGTLAGGPLACTVAGGSVNLTETQRRVYQTLGMLKSLSFSRPLPWTSQALYPWLVSAIDGMRFRTDITTSFCCDPPGFIDVAVASNSYLLLTPRWIDPSIGGGLYDLAALFVHEARHNNGKPHTCGSNDQTLTELGAWGAQYYLGIWTALYTGSQLDGPDADPSAYRASEIDHAEQTLGRFCVLPTANLAISLTDSPDPVVTGTTLTYTARVANSGPDTAPEAFVEAETPAGAQFTGASSSQGSCVGPPPAAAVGPIGCALGALAAGASATLTLTFKVVAAAGATIRPSGRWTAHVTGSANDAVSADNSASASTAVVSPPPPPPPPPLPCPGTPTHGGAKRVGTNAADTLTGTSGNDVICGEAGNDHLSGLAGNDLLRGGAGNDVIRGGIGADHVSGGDGRDTIYVRDNARDVVSCGAGRDVVYADRRDVVQHDCEIVHRSD